MTATPGTTQLSIADSIKQLIDSETVQLPPLPRVALKLKAMLNVDEADARKVSQLIETEPAMAASVMRVANSTAFGGLSAVRELHQAIARLGMKQVGSIVTALALKGHFVDESTKTKATLQAIWDHSIGTAFCARQIGMKNRDDPDEAFLAGLLHDIGKLIVLKAIDHLEADESFETPITEPVRDELIAELHPGIGHQILTRWKLPEPVCEAALRHERDDDTDAGPSLRCVQAAICVTRKMGLHPDPDPELNLLAEPAIEAIGINDIELAELMIDLEDELDEIRKLF